MKTSITTIVLLTAWSLFCTSTVQATSIASIHKASIHKNTKLCQVDIDYPKLEGLPHAAKMDAEILELVKEHLADFNNNRSNTVRNFFTGKFQIACATPDIVSIRFTFENRCPSYGRSLETFEDFNYCPKRSENVELDDIFSDSVKYADLLSVLSLNELITKEDQNLIEQAIGPNEEHYQDFTISDAGLDIHFGGKIQAEESAGAMGEHTVHVPWAAVKDLLSASSPVYQVALAAHSRTAQPPFTRDKLDEQIATIAIGAYSRLIDKSPDSAWGYRKRAAWHKKLGHTGLAEADLRKADSLDGRIATGSAPPTAEAQTTTTAQAPTKSNSEHVWYFGGALILIGLGAIAVWSRRPKKKQTGDENRDSDRS